MSSHTLCAVDISYIRINNDHILKHNKPLGFWNVKAACFLRGMDWIFKYRLHVFRLIR
jgi:hypothetical protein